MMTEGLVRITDQQLQSKVISFLRFPLIVGVLFIHSQTSLAVVGGISNLNTPVFNIVRDLFSYILSAVAVPLFFMMSGYLFFYNTEFSKECYKDKLKKRWRTLVIPYLFWNGIYLLFNVLVAYVPSLSATFKGSPISWEYVVTAFWGCTKGVDCIYPIAYQFWFIRDLIVMVLISPLFYIYVRRTRNLGITIIGLLWMLNISIPYFGMRGMSSVAIFFFMLGAWFSINKKNLITECRNLATVAYIAYPLLVIADLLTIHEGYNIFIHNLGIVVGIVFSFNIAGLLVQKMRMANIAFWSSVSFFVFAIHDPWILTQIRKVEIAVFHPNNDFVLLLLYFVNVLLTILIAVSIYLVTKKVAPHFIAVITGGR